MSAPVDVLAWFDAEIEKAASLSADAYQVEHAARLRIYRAAVAELIEAGKELVDAQADYDAIDFPSGRRLDRLSAARERHAAALARVQGGAK